MSSPIIYNFSADKNTYYISVKTNVKLDITLNDKSTGKAVMFGNSQGGGSFTDALSYSQSINTTNFYRIIPTTAVELRINFLATVPASENIVINSNTDLGIIDPSSKKSAPMWPFIIGIISIIILLFSIWYFLLRHRGKSHSYSSLMNPEIEILHVQNEATE